MWPKTFRESVCERFGYSPEMYESRVFWRYLYRRSLPLAWIIYLVYRKQLRARSANDLATGRVPQSSGIPGRAGILSL
jgi:hypothetical protein